MNLVLVHSGKVRDIYDVGNGCLLMVASDRISAFDVVLTEPITDKGRVLTAMTVFWVERLSDIAPSHLVSADPTDFPEAAGELGDIAGRAMLVRQAEMLPVECIVRGYLAGSAWKEYRDRGTVHGERLPSGLRESERLATPRFTPSTKARAGHDVNISFDEATSIVGLEVMKDVRELCVSAYEAGADLAREKGFVIADTKFELGFIDGRLSLCDEVLTPDSSRIWPASEVQPAVGPPSFDKQPVRDWLEATGWDKRPPPPRLPEEVVEATSQRYVVAYESITGLSLSDWYGPNIRAGRARSGGTSMGDSQAAGDQLR